MSSATSTVYTIGSGAHGFRCACGSWAPAGAMPSIKPAVVATATARSLWFALGASFVTLAAEGMLTSWTPADPAVLATGALFTALVFVVSLLHARGVERAFAMAAEQAKARERAAQSSLELERRYRLITESADDLIALLRSNGDVVYLSPSHERVLGLPKEPRG